VSHTYRFIGVVVLAWLIFWAGTVRAQTPTPDPAPLPPPPVSAPPAQPTEAEAESVAPKASSSKRHAEEPRSKRNAEKPRSRDSVVPVRPPSFRAEGGGFEHASSQTAESSLPRITGPSPMAEDTFSRVWKLALGSFLILFALALGALARW
jgi:hypothetical protein